MTILLRVFLFFCLLFFSTPCLPAWGKIHYTVEISTLPDNLSSLLASVSETAKLQKKSIDTLGFLQKRMSNDVQAMEQALKAKGYFKAVVATEIQSTSNPVRTRFLIRPGKRFFYGDVRLTLNPPSPKLDKPLQRILNRLSSSTGYSSSAVLDVETALLKRLQEHGYPTPSPPVREIVANHATNTVAVHFQITTGTAATFGITEIHGLETVSEDYVRSHLAWETDESFDIRLVDRSRENLIRTGLFRSVTLETHVLPDASRVRMRLNLLEGPRRSLRAGAWYYSDLGTGISAGWTNRNILGSGENLRVDTQLAEKLQSMQTLLTLPQMGHLDQRLDLLSKYEHQTTDSYTSTNLSLSAVLHRTFSELELGYGLAYRASRVKNGDIRNFNLISVPLLAEFSTTNDILDPTSGLALSVGMEPFSDITRQASSFILWNLTGRHFLPLYKRTVVLASRGRYSLLAGTDQDNIPKDLLLYAGGGGSVRGYAYQYAGDLDTDGTPLGGTSALDFSEELRLRINQDFGWVFFSDAGKAFGSISPMRQEHLFWGAGSGLRYFTPVGPIRFDVAVPLNRRTDVDAPYQLYFSLGQAF